MIIIYYFTFIIYIYTYILLIINKLLNLIIDIYNLQKITMWTIDSNIIYIFCWFFINFKLSAHEFSLKKVCQFFKSPKRNVCFYSLCIVYER